jgi:hypothetical protein
MNTRDYKKEMIVVKEIVVVSEKGVPQPQSELFFEHHPVL